MLEFFIVLENILVYFIIYFSFLKQDLGYIYFRVQVVVVIGIQYMISIQKL